MGRLLVGSVAQALVESDAQQAQRSGGRVRRLRCASKVRGGVDEVLDAGKGVVHERCDFDVEVAPLQRGDQ